MDTIITRLLIEVVMMKRPLIFVLILLISVFISNQNCETNAIGELNNKTLSSDIAIKNGNIVMISYFDSVSNKTHNHTEIYNISKLDNFMENTKRDYKDKARIVEYVRNGTNTWVNKLFDLEYDGNKIVDTGYDTYSNPNAFIPSQKVYSDFMEKRDYTDALWYGLCIGNPNDNSCYSLISFPKSSIVN